MDVSKNRGFSPKWMVKIMENPMNKWMIWGYHYFWKHPYMYINRLLPPRSFWRIVMTLHNGNQLNQRIVGIISFCNDNDFQGLYNTSCVAGVTSRYRHTFSLLDAKAISHWWIVSGLVWILDFGFHTLFLDKKTIKISFFTFP